MANEDYYGYLVAPEAPSVFRTLRQFGGTPMVPEDARSQATAALQDLIARTGAVGRGTMINRNAPVREPVFVVPPQSRVPAPAVPIAETIPGEWQGPPAPATIEESSIGPGIAIPGAEQITGQDLPQLVQPPMAGPRFSGIPAGRSDVLAAPPSRRYGSTRPQFIYTNPVAAQQAAANYQAQLAYEANQDQGYRDYMARREAERAATERANIQSEAYRNQLEAAGRESAAQRASNERITGMAESARARMLAQRDIEEARNRFLMGKSAADQLNRDPNARVNRNFVALDPATGRFVPAFPDPDQFQVPAPQAPSRAAVAVPQ